MAFFTRLNWQTDQDYLDCVQDLLDQEQVQSLADFVHHNYSNRLEHSLTVSYRAFCLARKFGLDKRATARAGLLHDLFFYQVWQKDQYGPKGHLYEHPRIALANAKKLTHLSDLEEDIILKHMWGATRDVPKYAESWLVTLMDKEAAMLEVSTGFYQASKGLSIRYGNALASLAVSFFISGPKFK